MLFFKFKIVQKLEVSLKKYGIFVYKIPFDSTRQEIPYIGFLFDLFLLKIRSLSQFIVDW